LSGLDGKNTRHHAFWQEFNGLFRQRIEADLASPALHISLRKISGDPELTEAKIRNHPAKWLTNQRLFHNQLQVTVEMQVVRMHLARVIDLMLADLETTIFNVGHGGIAGILGVIEKRRNSVEKITREEITNVDQKAAHIPVFPDEAVLEERLQALRHASEQLPEKIALQAQTHVEAFIQGSQAEMPFLRLSLRDVSNLIIKTYFIAPLEDTLMKLPGAYKRTWNQVRDALRLVLFNLGETNSPGDSAMDRRQLKSVLERAHQQVKDAGENLQKLQVQTTQSLLTSLVVCKEHLNPDNLVAQEAMWERNIRGEERLGGLRNGWMRLNQRFRNRWEQFLRIWRRTQADMLRAEFETAAARYRNPYASLQDFADQVKPRPEVMRLLPFYYKQLFAGSEGMGSAQMSNRERELSLAQTAARRMASGTGGAILVLGEALAGKTYFCEHIATTLFKGRLYRISPPPAGSCDPEELAGAFRRSLQSQGSISEMIHGLPRGAVFLMNDLEMWWERSFAGTNAITCIGALIEKHGRDHTFLLNANVHAYSLLQRLTSIETHIISTIVLSPFSRDNLRRTVMIRHHSGGLRFRWKEKEEEELSAREINRLFSRYFGVSNGNIGFALQLWLSHIESVHHQEMTISVPTPLKMPEIQHPDWLVLLTQFVLHKHLSLDRLLRIFDGEPGQDMTQLLEGILRAGLVIEIAQKVYAIEPYVYPYLISSLKRAQLL
jgi:hypothetical protein